MATILCCCEATAAAAAAAAGVASKLSIENGFKLETAAATVAAAAADDWLFGKRDTASFAGLNGDEDDDDELEDEDDFTFVDIWFEKKLKGDWCILLASSLGE